VSEAETIVLAKLPLAVARKVVSVFFQFEADFVESLRCIPMVVRYKLDSCGIKLKLEHWHRLSSSERQQLVNQACSTVAELAQYRQLLRDWTQRDWGEPAKDLPREAQPAWLDLTSLPANVVQACQVLNVNLTLDQWRSLTPLQRFALIKLARPSHEHRNLLPALREFGLAPC
jgi:hypothetical protein